MTACRGLTRTRWHQLLGIGARASLLLRQEHLGQQVVRLVDLAVLVWVFRSEAPHERLSEVLEVSEAGKRLTCAHSRTFRGVVMLISPRRGDTCSMAVPPGGAHYDTRSRQAESRVPMAIGVVVSGVLFEFLPNDFRIWDAARFWYPAFLLVFLLILVVADPGRIDRDRRWLRITTALMIGLIVVATVVSAIRLILGILTDASFSTAGQLLAIGGVVWVTNVVAFSLWYWDADAGGAAARAADSRRVPTSFVFPEMNVPKLVGPNWFPRYPDYLALSFNTAMAFSPTDVSAIRPWAKMVMVGQSVLSITIVALVIARAINIL